MTNTQSGQQRIYRACLHTLTGRFTPVTSTGQRNTLTKTHENGVFPSDNTQAGLALPGNYTGKYVSSLTVNGAVISILYGNDANWHINGRIVTLTAAHNLGSLTWDCTSSGVIPDAYLPPACR